MKTAWGKVRAGFAHAFALEAKRDFSAEDRALLARLADAIVARRMGGPAILFLETVQPLNYMGSQALVFLEPFIRPRSPDYGRLAEILESRAAIGELVAAIESRSIPA